MTQPDTGPVNDMRELYALQHAITDAGGTLTPGVHKAIDAMRETWDAALRRTQAVSSAGPAPATDQTAEIEQLREQLEEAETTAEQLARNVETVARERGSYRKAWKEEQRMRAKAEAELRRLADDADPIVGSLARDGFGLDEIAEMLSKPAPSAGGVDLRDRISRAMSTARTISLSSKHGPTEITGELDEIVTAVLAVLPATADRAAVFTDAERTMLRYALDQAQEAIWSQDGFTDEDQAAVTSLRRLVDETPAVAQAAAPHTGETQAHDGSDVVDAIVAALHKRAGELSELAEEQMRPSLEERAQEWNEAADVARKAAKSAVEARQDGDRP